MLFQYAKRLFLYHYYEMPIIIDFLIIYLTIHKTGSWGEWITGTILYCPVAIFAAYLIHMIGVGGETGILLLSSPVILVIVQIIVLAKNESHKHSSSTPREFKKATDLQVTLGTFIVFTCMMLSIGMGYWFFSPFLR